MQVWGIVVTPAGWCWDGMVAVGLAQCLPHGGQESRDFWETQTQSKKKNKKPKPKKKISTNYLRLICENEVRNQTKLDRRANLILSVLQSGGWTLRYCEQPGLWCYFNFSFTFPSVTQQRTEWYQTVETGSGLTVDQHGLQSLVLCRQLSLLSLQFPNPRSQEVKLTGVSWGQRWHARLYLHHLQG